MTDIPYILIRSARKTVAIQVTPAGKVLLRCPRWLPEAEAVRFLESKAAWVQEKRACCAAQPAQPALTEAELRALKEETRVLVQERLDKFAPVVGVDYGQVRIRCQRTRWGSCSSRGNLNFNGLLALAPPEVVDYVVVHELCHRREMNHSPRFWAQVERVLPDYARHRQWLRQNGGALQRRLER